MNSPQKGKFKFFIDVVGTCNLKCPACPVGNTPNVRNPKGIMSPQLLKKLMDKAVSESDVVGVALHNWTEPLLHPELPELIKIVQSYGVPCEISSNLNFLENPDDLISAGPHSIYVSVSGFEQTTYGLTHKKGNIETVKENIKRLVEAKQRLNGTTSIKMLFHRYKSGYADEVKLKEFAQDLGVGFLPLWAVMQPAEKIISYIGAGQTRALGDAGFEMIDRLALPLDEALVAAREYSSKPCRLQNQQVVLNVNGEVGLCCAVYDASKFKIANYLTTSLEEIQAIRKNFYFCKSCMSNGVHVYATYGAPEFDLLAMENFKVQ